MSDLADKLSFHPLGEFRLGGCTLAVLDFLVGRKRPMRRRQDGKGYFNFVLGNNGRMGNRFLVPVRAHEQLGYVGRSERERS
jgi:hypothetical protein